MADDTLILGLDTATPQCSVALTCGGPEDGTVIAARSLGSGVTHSRRLLSSIDLLLSHSSRTLAALSAIAVGLRIGMATAKGLAHGAGKVLIGISSLDAIAAVIRDERLICVLLDARKNEVYGRFYRADDKGIARPCSQHTVSAPGKIAGQINEPVVMAGDGVDVYSEQLKAVLGSKMVRSAVLYPPAEMIGFLADEQYRNGRFLHMAAAEPLYVRASDAELSLIRSGQ